MDPRRSLCVSPGKTLDAQESRFSNFAYSQDDNKNPRGTEMRIRLSLSESFMVKKQVAEMNLEFSACRDI